MAIDRMARLPAGEFISKSGTEPTHAGVSPLKTRLAVAQAAHVPPCRVS